MDPRKPLAIRHSSAHQDMGVAKDVALWDQIAEVDYTSLAVPTCRQTWVCDTPFHSLWPVRPADGPFFQIRHLATFRQSRSLGFSTAGKGPIIGTSITLVQGYAPCLRPMPLSVPVQVARRVLHNAPSYIRWQAFSRDLAQGCQHGSVGATELCVTTSTRSKRGSQKCINPLSSSRCFPRPCRAVLRRMTVNVLWSAVLRAPWVPARLAMTRSLVLPSASALVPCATRQASASAGSITALRPSRRARYWAIRGDTPDGFLRFRPRTGLSDNGGPRCRGE